MRAIRRGKREAPTPYGLLAAVGPRLLPRRSYLWFRLGNPENFRQPSHRAHLPQNPPFDRQRESHTGRAAAFRVLLGSAVLSECDYSWLSATSGRWAKLVVLRFFSPRNYRFGGHRCYISSQYGIKRVTTDATDVICRIKFGLCQTISLLSVKHLSAYV